MFNTEVAEMIADAEKVQGGQYGLLAVANHCRKTLKNVEGTKVVLNREAVRALESLGRSSGGWGWTAEKAPGVFHLDTDGPAAFYLIAGGQVAKYGLFFHGDEPLDSTDLGYVL